MTSELRLIMFLTALMPWSDISLIVEWKCKDFGH